MRNEIYEKIRQSRMRYIEELKKSGQEKPSENLKIVPEERGCEVAKGEPSQIFALVKGVWHKDVVPRVAKNSGIVLQNIRKSVIWVKKGIAAQMRKIVPLFATVNRKINEAGDKMTDGFYTYSSRFFEDRYELVDNDERQEVLQMQTPAAIALRYENYFIDSSSQVLNTLWQKMLKTRLVRSIVLFFEIDDMAESNMVNHSALKPKRIEAKQEKMTDAIYVFKTGIKEIGKTLKKLIGTFRMMHSISNHYFRNSFKTLTDRSKTKSKRINFPAINRFVRS